MDRTVSFGFCGGLTSGLVSSSAVAVIVVCLLIQSVAGAVACAALTNVPFIGAPDELAFDDACTAAERTIAHRTICLSQSFILRCAVDLLSPAMSATC